MMSFYFGHVKNIELICEEFMDFSETLDGREELRKYFINND